MDSTTNLNLPYIMAAQAQKHVTHNEALRTLDAVVQLSVLDKDLATPPGSPSDGARYIVAASPTGAWSGQAGKIAAYQDGAWLFYPPLAGWLAWVADESKLYGYSGSAWSALPTGTLTSVSAADLATTVPPLGIEQPLNLGLVASVTSNALTIAVKGADGNDPSSTNPVLIPFRSATPATGTPVVRKLAAVLSLTVSSGSTLGTSSNVPFHVWVVLFDDGGTLRLGAINCYGSGSIYPLCGWQVASSSAEGGAGGSDSAKTFYTGTAVSSKAYVVLGYLSWESGLTAAGTWASGPSRIELLGPTTPRPGQAVQSASQNTVGTGQTVHTSASYTDTNSQVTLAPTSAANLVVVEATSPLGFVNSGQDNKVQAAITRGGAVIGAATHHHFKITAGSITAPDPQEVCLYPCALKAVDAPGTTSSTTWKVRVKVTDTSQLGTWGGQGLDNECGAFMAATEIMV